jgi:hypothetical protein
MKKAVILRATGGELANQLWNCASIYAYARERGAELENPAFYEYGNYFLNPAPNLFWKLFFFLPFTNYTKRKHSFKRRLWRKLYDYCAKAVILAHPHAVLVSDNKDNIPFLLPPTNSDVRLAEVETANRTVYFDGWLFRNPVGLKTYRDDIRSYLRPRPDIEHAVGSTLSELRSAYAHVVGVHIRQGDYATWRGGEYLIPQSRVREILDEYLREHSLAAATTCFVITSDGPVDETVFAGLSTKACSKSAVHDLFLLSGTDAIIGSNSTFGAFASYYGDIPFIVMQKAPMDWELYRDKDAYFENKHSTFVHYG